MHTGIENQRVRVSEAGSYEYKVQVVPTKYHGAWGGVSEGTQYAARGFLLPTSTAGAFPGVSIAYHFQPVALKVSSTGSMGLTHLVVRILAVLSGCVGMGRALDHLLELVGGG